MTMDTKPCVDGAQRHFSVVRCTTTSGAPQTCFIYPHPGDVSESCVTFSNRVLGRNLEAGMAKRFTRSLCHISKPKTRRPRAAGVSKRPKVRFLRKVQNSAQSHHSLINKDNTLQGMPTEMLEQIFLECPNPNLLRANCKLALRLSNASIKRQVFLEACCSEGAFEQDPVALRKLGMDKSVLADLQTLILCQPWVTWEFVSQLHLDFLASAITRAFSEHNLHWLGPDKPAVTPSLTQTIRQDLERYAVASANHPIDCTQACREFRWDEPDGRRVTVDLGFLKNPLSIRIIQKGKTDVRSIYCFSGFLNLDPACKIPKRLLHGPWLPEKHQLLAVLIRAGASVDWINTTAGEVAERGLRAAVKENCVPAIKTLTAPKRCGVPIVMGACRKLSKTTGTVGVIPKQEHLVQAIQNGCEQPTMNALLSAGEIHAAHLDLQAPSVTAQLLAMERQKHPSAPYLKLKRCEDRIARRQPIGPRRPRHLILSDDGLYDLREPNSRFLREDDY